MTGFLCLKLLLLSEVLLTQIWSPFRLLNPSDCELQEMVAQTLLYAPTVPGAVGAMGEGLPWVLVRPCCRPSLSLPLQIPSLSSKCLREENVRFGLKEIEIQKLVFLKLVQVVPGEVAI